MSTTIKFASVKSGSTSKCMKLMCDKIKNELKLMRDQIISISIHDTKLYHGDLECVLFYRSDSVAQNSEPTDSINYHTCERDEDTPWGDILNEILINSNSRGKYPVCISSTFRMVGDEKVSVNMKMDGKCKQVFEYKISVNNQVQNSWDDLIDKAKNFLNEYIAPEEFLGITVFEDEHPLAEREAENGLRNLIIYHTAEKNKGQMTLTPLKELTQDIVGDIYTITKIELPEAKTWENTYNQAIQVMTESGQLQGHSVATATSSDADCNGFQLALCVKYDLTQAETLHDLRGEGGCACNIF